MAFTIGFTTTLLLRKIHNIMLCSRLKVFILSNSAMENCLHVIVKDLRNTVSVHMYFALEMSSLEQLITQWKPNITRQLQRSMPSGAGKNDQRLQ